MRVLLAFFTLSVLVQCPRWAYAKPEPPRIDNVAGSIGGSTAQVRFTLRNAFPPEVVEALKSGIEITFKITVRVERVYRGWFDPNLGEVRYTRSVRYDALARVYRLQWENGSDLLPDVHAALDRMTRFEVAVPIRGEVVRGKPYFASVRARLDKVGLSDPLRSILFFSSLWDVETEWARGRLDTP